MRYKQITAGVFVFALALALVATAGFGASGLDRNTTITVVEHDHAAVGLQACYLPNEAAQQANGGGDGPASETGDGQANRVTPVNVEITNRLGSELTVRELTVDGAIVHNRPYAMTIPAGGYERVTIPVRSEPSEVTASVSANGVSTRITISDISHDGCPFPVTLPSPGEDEQGSTADGAADGAGGANEGEGRSAGEDEAEPDTTENGPSGQPNSGENSDKGQDNSGEN